MPCSVVAQCAVRRRLELQQRAAQPVAGIAAAPTPQKMRPRSGEGSFGILSYGSCGYTNSDGSLPYARTAYAAMADANPDYPGGVQRARQPSCGASHATLGPAEAAPRVSPPAAGPCLGVFMQGVASPRPGSRGACPFICMHGGAHPIPCSRALVACAPFAPPPRLLRPLLPDPLQERPRPE